MTGCRVGLQSCWRCARKIGVVRQKDSVIETFSVGAYETSVARIASDGGV